MYRDPTKRQRKNLFYATMFVLALFAFDYFSGGAIRIPVRSTGLVLWGGANNVFTRIGASGFFATRAGLTRENKSLQERIAAMQGELAAARAASSRMKELEAAAHLVATTPGVSAPVVSSLRVSPYGTFYIGAGSKDGVQKGALVLSAEGFALGRIADVFTAESLVREFFAPGEKIEAIVADRPVSLSGSGGGNAKGELPRGASVEAGTMIFARGDRVHAIGVVGHIEGDPTSASLKLHVRTPVNLETISYVYVLQ